MFEKSLGNFKKLLFAIFCEIFEKICEILKKYGKLKKSKSSKNLDL